MFIVLSSQKRVKQPHFAAGLPIIGFLSRKGRPTAFHKGWFLQPVVLESDYIAAIAAAVPAPRRRRIPLYKTPRRAVKPRRAVFKVLKGWESTHAALKRINRLYPNTALGAKASRFQGFIRHSKSLLNLTLWDKPKLPKRLFTVEGFNMFVLVRVKDHSPTVKHKDDFLIAGAVVRWHGSMRGILKKIYSDTISGQKVPQGPSIQNTVPWRTALDSLAMQFFDKIGEPERLMGIQFREKFNRYERGRIKHLQKERDRRIRSDNKKPRWRRRFYRKNPKKR